MRWIAVALLIFVSIVNIALLRPNNQLVCRDTSPLPIPHLVGGPVVQLELARSEDDIRSVLMAGDTEENVKDARQGNRYETFLFIPGYTALFLVLARLIDRRRFAIAACAICLAAVSDWVENAGIERTLTHIESTGQPQPGDANAISRPSIVKWSLLSVILLGLGVTAIRRHSAGMVALGSVLLFSGAAVLVQLAIYFPERHHF